MVFLIPLRTSSRIRTRRPTWYPSKYIRPCRCDDEETTATKTTPLTGESRRRAERGKREGERPRDRARESKGSRSTLEPPLNGARSSPFHVSWSLHTRGSGEPASGTCALYRYTKRRGRERERGREKRGCGRRIVVTSPSRITRGDSVCCPFPAATFGHAAPPSRPSDPRSRDDES